MTCQTIAKVNTAHRKDWLTVRRMYSLLIRIG